MNRIGIETGKAKSLSQSLGHLLADYQIFYTNVRGFHWNIKGDKFFELHVKFEDLYNDLTLKVDEISERILTLGYQPEHRFSKYADLATIKEAEKTSDARKNVENIVESMGWLIRQQRSILTMAGEANDEGTAALMSDYIREQEKSIWMYSAFLNK